MNSDEIQATIERLKAETDKSIPSVLDIANAFMGTAERWTPSTMRDALVGLLETTLDSMPLPKDADGEALRLGDLVRYKDDKGVLSVRYIHLETDHDGQASRPVWMIGDLVRCRDDGKALSVRYILGVGRGEDYWAVTPSALVHHHKPAIKDVLRDFLSAVEEAKRKGYDDVPDEEYAEYAEKLRETLRED